ncbi:MAG: transcriptional regulator, IclR family [Hyphomicrobiales bacterium]|nr:transcriptional regulator, IclR family [Hyphomicrobiales bacterium]
MEPDLAEETDTAGSPIRAVQRAFQVLRAFTPEQPSMTVAELQQRVGISRPTLYRLLATLECEGLVKGAGDPLRYQLDFGVARIANAWFRNIDPARVAAPILTRLWHRVDETVAFLVPRGTSRICVVEYAGSQKLSYARGLGHVDHIAATASGRSILAFADAATIQDALATLSEAERENVEAELGQIRRKGYAISNGSIEGIRGVAVPVFDRSAFVSGSVSITGPETRLQKQNLKRCIEEARRAASEVSIALGFEGNPQRQA